MDSDWRAGPVEMPCFDMIASCSGLRTVDGPAGAGRAMANFDSEWVRSQFPALRQEIGGRPVVFLDGPGGTQVPQRVIDAVGEYFRTSNSNTHGSFATSRWSDQVLAEAHAAVADLLGCDSREIIFGPNMTTLTFAMSRAIGREINPGDEIIVTDLDHDANVAPWRALEERGAVIRTAPVRTSDCTVNMDSLLGLFNERTRLVAIGYASNSVGTINDVATVVRAAHRVGAWAYVDAVHYAPHGPIDVRALDCDFLACSAYKFFGPHVGALYGKAEHLERLRPYKVRPADDCIPDRWETGTQNHEGLAGTIAAIDYLAQLGRRHGADGSAGGRRAELFHAMNSIRGYERELAVRLVEGLLAIDGLELYGIREPERFDQRAPTVSIRLNGATPQELAAYLGGQGIFVWDGNYYALSLSQRLGVEESGGMVRIGIAHYNTIEEVERLLGAVRDYPRR